MADGAVVVDNVLCFLLSRFGKSSAKHLKSAVLDFYSFEVICCAKKHLLQATEDIKSDIHLPHIPLRREGELRASKSLDDVMTIITCLDENLKISSLPKYVAESPDAMPYMRLYDGDLRPLMMAFDKLSDRLDKTEAALAAIMKAVCRPTLKHVSSTNAQCLSEWPPLSGQSQLTAHSVQQVCAQAADDGARETETVFSGDFQSGFEWSSVVEAEAAAAAASTPISVRNRYAPLGSTTDDDERQQFKVVQPRRNKRSYRQSADVSTDQTNGTNRRLNSGNPSQRRRVFVYGKSTASSAITAAERKRKRAVFCIDNVNLNCTEDQMKSFVESMGIEVFTCYKAKSRRRRDEDDAAVDKRSAFRVCISADDTKRLLDPRAWPDSITVSEWFFKQPTDEQAVNDKRRRVGSGDRKQLQSQRTGTSTLSRGESSDGGAAGAGVDGNHDATAAVMSCCTSDSINNMDEDVADDAERTVIMSDELTTFTQDGGRPL